MKPETTFKSILVVDDDPFTLNYTARMLTNAGFIAVLAANGEEALRWLAADRFAAVVSDVVMPRMNGFELLEIIQSRFPGLPAVLVTASKRPGMREAALACGATTLLEKPVDRQELVAALAQTPDTQTAAQDNNAVE